MSADALSDAVDAAKRDPRVAPAVRAIYQRLSAATDERRPRCDRSGKCCRFDAYGHRLYVSTAELAVFAHELTSAGAADEPAGCAFQRGGACTVHEIRPLGCRMFFCDPTAEQWQQDWYATLHGEMRRLHGELGLQYHYIEWRDALRQLSLVGPPQPARGLPILSSKGLSL